MGIKKKLGKLSVFLLMIIAVAILVTGCLNQSENTPNETAVGAPAPTITPMLTAMLTPDMSKVAKLKIMSVTSEPATLGGIPIIMKVKNIGDAVAKDVYAGGINIQRSQTPLKSVGAVWWTGLASSSWEKYPSQLRLINQSIQNVLISGSSSIDTGFVYTPFLFSWNKIPGSDNERLRVFIQNFDIDWEGGIKIEKIENGNTIRLTNGTRNLSLRINNEKTKITIEFDDGRTDELIVKNENGNLNVYYTSNTLMSGGLIVTGTLSSKDYLGDILPDETKTAQFTAPINDASENSLIKVAWIDETKEFTLY